jgi:hypothetical protein
MNDETFVSGGITNASPFLLAFLEDKNGINTASGIGHDIVAILDGDVSNPYLLNDYYQTNLDDYTKGTLRFPLRNLAGIHTITFRRGTFIIIPSLLKYSLLLLVMNLLR